MTKYIQSVDASKVSTGLTPTGITSRQLAYREETEQRRVAENPEWLIARELELSYAHGKHIIGDSRPKLERLGFAILGEYDDLFYRVKQPEGWSKSTEEFWTTIKDAEGKKRMEQFYKGAYYDRRASLYIEHIDLIALMREELLFTLNHVIERVSHKIK